MALFDSVKGLFGSRKRTLNDLSMDELRREKTRLEQTENKLIKQVEELERRKQELFQKGVEEGSERQRRIYARKIKELDVEAKNIDKNLRFISRQLRVVNGFIQLKKNQALMEQMGLSDIISSMDIQDLQAYVEQASVEGEFNFDKLNEVLRNIEEADRLVEITGEDKDIEEIVRAMEEARLAGTESPEAVQVARQKLDEALGSEEEG